MKETHPLDNTVWLTFPTTKETNEMLNTIAKFKGIKQPQLLNEIVQDYIISHFADFLCYCAEEGIDLEKYFNQK